MSYPSRIYYTEKDKALMWDRWQKGESLHSIARHFGRSHSSIQGVLGRTGGHPAIATATITTITDVGRARRDISRTVSRAFAASDCIGVGTCTVDRQP